jgi:hypothetical protein
MSTTPPRKPSRLVARISLVVITGMVIGSIVQGVPSGNVPALAFTDEPRSNAISTAMVSPTPEPTETAPPARTATLFTSDEVVVFRQQITLTGTIEAIDQTCVDAEEIRIVRQVHGVNELRNTATVTSDAEGSFSKTITISESADYVALVRPGDGDTCPRASSNPVTVLAKALVTASASPRVPVRRTKFEIEGKVAAPHPGSTVVLQRRVDVGVWVAAGSVELDERSRFVFARRARWKGKRKFRVKWLGGDADHEPGVSERVVVRTRRKRARG